MSKKSTAESEDSTRFSSRDQREAVRHRYGEIARGDTDKPDRKASEKDDDNRCCGGSETETSSCCSEDIDDLHARNLGYSAADLSSVPEGANLGLGCGNPKALAELRPGESVVDLGSGGGFDCFLAANEVGDAGHVIGVDMTPQMVERARLNADRQQIANVEFRLGEIEHLPIPDEQVDVVISNCVINLSPEKDRVFEEAFRILKPGGRLAISDIVMTPEGNAELKDTDLDQLARCISGAATIETLQEIVENAGFQSVSIRPKDNSEEIIREMYDDEELDGYLHSAVIEGEKPA